MTCLVPTALLYLCLTGNRTAKDLTMTSFPFRAALAATFLLAAAAAAAEPALTSSPTAAPPAAPALVATSTAGPAAGKPGVAGPRLESVLKECSSRTFWQANYPVPVLDRTLVTQSLDDARTYLQRQQRDDGLFNGDYDIPTKQRLERPGAAVQAHALWALIRGTEGRPTAAAIASIQRGLNAFFIAMRPQVVALGSGAPVFEGDGDIRTATVAALALAIMDYLDGKDFGIVTEARQPFRKWLDLCILWLQKMEADNGSWAVSYIPDNNQRDSTPDAFTDGLCLLAYTRATADGSYPELEARLKEARRKLLIQYLVGAWCGKRDAAQIRRFAPAAALAYAAGATRAGDPAETTLCGDAALSLAWWLLLPGDILHRERQPASNALPLLAAARVAMARGDAAAAADLRPATDELLIRALRHQVRSPLWTRNPAVFSLQLPENLTGGLISPPDNTRMRLDDLPFLILALRERQEAGFPEPAAAGP